LIKKNIANWKKNDKTKNKYFFIKWLRTKIINKKIRIKVEKPTIRRVKL
jgi:hypothetical protein